MAAYHGGNVERAVTVQWTITARNKVQIRVSSYRPVVGFTPCWSVYCALYGRQEHPIEHVVHWRWHAMRTSDAHDGTDLGLEL